jgi:hypothetical protein
MKKKRVVFPEKMKQWIDARKKYTLNHVQVEMARELGMDPKNFEGIAKHIQEFSKQQLSDFIEAEYRLRFGKNEPVDRRSIEQKLKAEAAEKEQKRLQKSMSKAAAKWESVPDAEKKTIISTVWCSQCMAQTTIIEIECQMINNDLMLSGKCAVCATAVGRFVEGK